MSLTSYRAALPRSLLVCDKASEDSGFVFCCKGYFCFFSGGGDSYYLPLFQLILLGFDEGVEP